MKLPTANSKQQNPIAFYLHLSLFYLLLPTYTNLLDTISRRSKSKVQAGR